MNETQTSGWIILDKPAGMSSRYAGSKIARMFGTKKFGHLGTLDPFATGVLPIALGHATKMIPFLENANSIFKERNQESGIRNWSEKEYLFQIKWGIRTDTDDITGKIAAENDLRPTIDQITGVFPKLTGKIMQTPPAYSAIHVGGVRAYELARRGQNITIPKRRVFIESLDLIPPIEKCGTFFVPPTRGRVGKAEINPHNSGQIDDIWYRVKCSTGTYVRSIAQDIARLINESSKFISGRQEDQSANDAFICTTSAIRRVRNYGFEIKNAVTLDFLENVYHNTPDLLREYLWPIDFGLDDILVAKLDGDAASLFQNGGRIVARDNNVGYARVYNGPQFIGIAESRNGVLHPKRIIKD